MLEFDFNAYEDIHYFIYC